MHAVSFKRIGLIVAVAASSAFVWSAALPWLKSPFLFSGWWVIVWPALALTLQGAVVGLAWMMLDGVLERLAAILASWATFVLFWHADIWYLTMLPVFAGLWYLSSRRIRNDLTDRHKVRVSTSLGAGISPAILGTFLMLSLGFYLLPAYHSVGASDVSTGIQGQIRSTYENPAVKQQLDQLPATQRAQVESDLSKNVDSWVKRFLGPLGPFLPPLLAFGLFLVLWSTLFIFRELSIWLGVILLWLLRSVGFVHVEEKDVKAEVLVL